MINWYPGNSYDKDWKFSIIIPTWNNLSFLKLCIESIIRNSGFRHQIIIHVNEGTDGTLEWVREKGLDYTLSENNDGVCWALNACRALVRTDYIAYLNDDMYVLPGWDLELWKEIEKIPDQYFFLSSTIIEPRKSPHAGVLDNHDYGSTIENFREQELLADFKSIKGTDWNGSTWPPNIVHRNLWDLIGGYSIEFFPGLYSDPDFSMKLYEAGVRYFKGIDASRAYHFGSKSTARIKLNKGSRQFLNKWGITSESFTSIFLKRGRPYEGIINVGKNSFSFRKAYARSFLKRLITATGGTGRKKGKYSYNTFNSDKE